MLQPLALNILKSWRNVFLTGQAGSGKTYVINQYIRRLRSCNIHVAITASTGIAATHIGGVTIHSRAGIGIKETLTHHDLELIQQKEHIHKSINKAKVLIIDEISMLSANTIDMVDQVCQMMRRDGRAFGGLQVVLIGDFFQLPPVMGAMPDWSESPKRFAFAAKAWKHLDLMTCYLETQHRQSGWLFTDILNALRIWQIQPDHLTHLKHRLHQDLSHPNLVRLYTHNIDVDRINADHLHALDPDLHTYTAVSEGDPKIIQSMLKSMLAPELLSLKVGAQVIFVKNNPSKWYYNGTTGRVISCEKTYTTVETAPWITIKVEPETWSIEQANDIVASVRQIPLKLAWAITVHKSQGMTLDAAEMDLSRVFEPGQAYVALSRIRSLDGLKLLWLNESWLAAHPLVVRGDTYFLAQSDQTAQIYTALTDEEFALIHQQFISAIGGQYVSEIVDKEKYIITKPTKQRKPKVEKWSSIAQTVALMQEGKTLEEIVAIRGYTASTIIQHILDAKTANPDLSLWKVKPNPDTLARVRKAIDVLKTNPEHANPNGTIKLSPIFNHLNGSVSYDEIRLCVMVG